MINHILMNSLSSTINLTQALLQETERQASAIRHHELQDVVNQTAITEQASAIQHYEATIHFLQQYIHDQNQEVLYQGIISSQQERDHKEAYENFQKAELKWTGSLLAGQDKLSVNKSLTFQF